MFLTHLLAWPCGSIMSGQRRALDTMMPFSTDSVSVGRPAMVQERTLTGSCGGHTVGQAERDQGTALVTKRPGGNVRNCA